MFETIKKTPGICKKIAAIKKLKDITFINGNGDELFIRDYEFDLDSCDGYDEPEYLTSKAEEALKIGNHTILASDKDNRNRYWLDPMLNLAQKDPGYEDEDIVQIRCPSGFFKNIQTTVKRADNTQHIKIRTIADEDLSLQIGKVFTIVTVEVKDNKIISTKVEHLEFNENTANEIVQMIKSRG